jgi:deoxyadenosine/deoxycytidine kinase
MKSGYIVVEGPIGVGKTSLARRLADALDARALLEMPEENPFLERFYRSREQFALPTQLFFLFQRARQIQELKQGELFSSGAVSDFLIEKDRLFALANLDTDELRLYEQVYGQTIRELPAPDRVVYLQAPVDVLLDRIRRRGVPYEDLIDRPYLQALVDAYTRFFHHYTAAPLLVVNAAQINFVDRDEDFGMLLDYIMRIRSGRHFFNPMAAS